MNGTVGSWNEARGYGFIDADGNRSDRGLFVHRTSIVDVGRQRRRNEQGRPYLVVGDRVTFEEAPGRGEGKGPQAVNVRVV